MLRNGFEVQQAAIKALLMREIKTRFGKYRLGYLWAILEPSTHLMILLVLFGYIMHRTMPDISYPIFLLNGLIPYFLFSSISTRSIGAISANQGLFNYRPVKPIDTIIARTILEFVIYTFVYTILMVMVKLSGDVFSVENIPILIITWGLLTILSCGLGIIFMTLGCILPELEKILPILIKPLYFISCVMFPLHAIPKDYWQYLLWNPLVHAIELSRYCIYSGYFNEYISINYLAFCALLMFFLGLTIYRVFEKRIFTL